MITYKLPQDHESIIEEFDKRIDAFKAGELNEIAFKGIRVANGVYEQRKAETYMLRIRNAGCLVTPAQLRRVSELSEKYGSEEFHATTRGELQLHYVDASDITSVNRGLAEVNLSSKGGGGNTIRNIMVPEDSGIKQGENFDVTPYAIELTTRMIQEKDSWELPRKFKIAFSNDDNDSIRACVTCLGFIAQNKDGVKGFKVYVGGGMGARPMPGKVLYDFVEDTEVYEITKAMKNLFDKKGNRKNRNQSRLKFLVDKLGIDGFRDALAEERAALESVQPLQLSDYTFKSVDVALEPVTIDTPEFALWKDRYVAPQKQEGYITIKVPLYLGDIYNNDGIALADFMENFGEDVIRISIRQNLHLRNIPEQYAGNVYEFLKNMTSLFDSAQVVGDIVTCTGADTCKLGLCLPRRVQPEIIKILNDSDLDLDKLKNVKINISGCPNSCGVHHMADLGFFGKAVRKDGKMYPGYNVIGGAQIREGLAEFAQKVGVLPSKNMPEFIKALLGKYLADTDAKTPFGDWFLQDEGQVVKDLLEIHGDAPTYDEDASYYRDWGVTEDFSILKGQKAECAASIYDMIDVDKKAITVALKTVDDTDIDLGQLTYDLVFYSSRMLLVTRSIEANTTDEVFDGFIRALINIDLVDEKYKALVTLAKKGDTKVMVEHKDLAVSLANDVIALYGTMNDSLKFSGVSE